MIKVFVCHICGYEFPLKVLLERHFDSHVESSVLDSVLDMEEVSLVILKVLDVKFKFQFVFKLDRVSSFVHIKTLVLEATYRLENI